MKFSKNFLNVFSEKEKINRRDLAQTACFANIMIYPIFV